MENDENKKDISTCSADKEVDILLKELELDWQDHFEIRKQSWNTVIASGH